MFSTFVGQDSPEQKCIMNPSHFSKLTNVRLQLLQTNNLLNWQGPVRWPSKPFALKGVFASPCVLNTVVLLCESFLHSLPPLMDKVLMVHEETLFALLHATNRFLTPLSRFHRSSYVFCVCQTKLGLLQNWVSACMACEQTRTISVAQNGPTSKCLSFCKLVQKSPVWLWNCYK